MSKRKGDVDVIEFMVSFHRDSVIFVHGNVDSEIETRVGTWGNSQLACACGMGRETRLPRRLTPVSQGCTK